MFACQFKASFLSFSESQPKKKALAIRGGICMKPDKNQIIKHAAISMQPARTYQKCESKSCPVKASPFTDFSRHRSFPGAAQSKEIEKSLLAKRHFDI